MKNKERELNFNQWMEKNMISTMWVEDTYEKKKFMERLRDTHIPIEHLQTKSKIYG